MDIIKVINLFNKVNSTNWCLIKQKEQASSFAPGLLKLSIKLIDPLDGTIIALYDETSFNENYSNLEYSILEFLFNYGK